VRYLKSSRLHVSAKIDGAVYKKGSKFASAWKLRFAALKGSCTLEYFTEQGGESLGKLNMADGKVRAFDLLFLWGFSLFDTNGNRLL
jgi:hypothetical protein